MKYIFLRTEKLLLRSSMVLMPWSFFRCLPSLLKNGVREYVGVNAG